MNKINERIWRCLKCNEVFVHKFPIHCCPHCQSTNIELSRVEYTEPDYKRYPMHISNEINRQLQWAGFFLASLIGIIELLPMIYDNIEKSQLSFNSPRILITHFITTPIIVLFFLLLSSIIFCSNRIIGSIHEIYKFERRLVKYGWGYTESSYNLLILILLGKKTGKIRKNIVMSFHIILILFSSWIIVDAFKANFEFYVFLVIMLLAAYFGLSSLSQILKQFIQDKRRRLTV